MSKRTISGVNAGSMADIAFLLLIFFMMTATIDKDKGLARLLPSNIEQPIVDIKQKNLFEIRINKNDELFVENELMELRELRQATIDFIDNGGAVAESPNFCDYCKGHRNPESSDHPKKAVVLVNTDRVSSYKTYIAVQNELLGAYNFLRNRESQDRFGWKYTEVKRNISEGVVAKDDFLAYHLKEIQQLIPLNLVEAELKRN